LADREINHTSFSIWRYARDFATIALWQRQKAVSNLDQVKALEPAPLAGKRVVVGIDGGRARIRVDKRTLDQTKTRAYTGVKSEPKLFIIYTIDRTGNKEDQSKVIYDGTI